MNHTPTPWKFSFECVDPEWAIVTTESGAIIANVNADHRQEANAQFIVRAVNSHDALVLAIKAFIKYDADEAEDGVAMMLNYEEARTAAINALAIVEAA